MCGLFAAFRVEKAAELTYMGLRAEQHRAEDFAGIVTTDRKNLYRHAGSGWVSYVFRQQDDLDKLHGRSAIGHIRYPTVDDEGDPSRDNTQPIVAAYYSGYVAMGHNGNLTNADDLRRELSRQAPLATSMDTECILRLFCGANTGSIITDLEYALSRVRGTYSLTLLFTDPECFVLVRDPSGNRPLWIGQIGESWFAASESVALRKIGATVVRQVRPGEVIIIDEQGLSSHMLRGLPKTPRAECIFEDIYFLHPASLTADGVAASEFRLRLGEKLAELFPVSGAGLIIGVPSSAYLIGRGYARALGKSDLCLPGLIRSNYVGRSFIAVNQDLREAIAEQKFFVDESLVVGRIVVLVDDSIVRGTTIKILVRSLFEAKAREVHVRVGCPPIAHPCRYGINMPTYGELAAATKSLDEIRREVTATSLEWLPIDVLRGLARDPDNRCFACMTGQYPLPE